MTAAAATIEAAFEYLQNRLARMDVVHVLTVDGPDETVAPATTLVSRTP